MAVQLPRNPKTHKPVNESSLLAHVRIAIAVCLVGALLKAGELIVNGECMEAFAIIAAASAIAAIVAGVCVFIDWLCDL